MFEEQQNKLKAPATTIQAGTTCMFKYKLDPVLVWFATEEQRGATRPPPEPPKRNSARNRRKGSMVTVALNARFRVKSRSIPWKRGLVEFYFVCRASLLMAMASNLYIIVFPHRPVL